MKKEVRGYTKYATWIIGCLIFALSVGYIIRSFDWSGIAEVLRRFRPAIFFLGAGGSILLYWAVRAIRWSVILNSMNVRIRFTDLYLCSSVMLSFSIFTPVQSGELLKVELLRKFGMIERFSGYGSFVAERVIDFITVCVLAYGGLFFYGGIAVNYKIALLIPFVASVLILCALFIVDRYIMKRRVVLLYQSIKQSLNSRGVLIKVIFLTLLSWGLVAFGWQLSLSSLFINIGFFESVALATMMALVYVLSFIPGAIGIAEVSASTILVQFGQDPASAQAGALILRSYGLLVGLLGVIHLMILIALRKNRGRRPVDSAT